MSDEVSAADVEQPSSEQPAPRFRPLRVWPAVLCVALLWGLQLVPRLAEEMTMPVMMVGFMGPLASALLIVLWWLLLSRARLLERLVGLTGLIAVAAVTTVLSDKSIQTFGMMIYGLPWGFTGFALALIALGRWQSFGRTWLALLAALVGFGFWDLVRTDEIRGDFQTTRNWRWVPTAEDQFLQGLAEVPQSGEAPPATQTDAQPLAAAEWPGFRGPNRDGVVPGLVLTEDWKAQPPREIWRIQVGPGWSSFAVAGNRLFTQEQRGEDEVVVCYDAESGATVWVHQDSSRFWEAIGGAGPRATPTIADGMLFTLGANGLLNRLDPLTGQRIWQRDLTKDASRQPPTWGFSSSPLVTGGLVIVHVGGAEGQGVLAYDVESGRPRWAAPAGDHTYSSPHLAEVAGIPSVLLLDNHGLLLLDPADGTLQGQHAWKFEGYRVVQPLVLDGSSVLLGTAMGTGTRRVEVRADGERLQIETAWTSRYMNPYYNDYVAHEGYLYGFDNNIFACIDLATGARQWKGGRYGNGQVLLLPDQDQLLVLSEDGELVLLRATPQQHTELARHGVLEGRTWNHHVLVGNRLYVRNSEQAACFELALAAGDP
ncbi:MAG: PQQ-binding-like beta-propeller repeat protein [Pirellulaceae bacterium]|nr:PQQ-binding-like beta-propeller repeat protein [Pirellulaceae bacterium]